MTYPLTRIETVLVQLRTGGSNQPRVRAVEREPRPPVSLIGLWLKHCCSSVHYPCFSIYNTTVLVSESAQALPAALDFQGTVYTFPDRSRLATPHSYQDWTYLWSSLDCITYENRPKPLPSSDTLPYRGSGRCSRNPSGSVYQNSSSTCLWVLGLTIVVITGSVVPRIGEVPLLEPKSLFWPRSTGYILDHL